MHVRAGEGEQIVAVKFKFPEQVVCMYARACACAQGERADSG